MHVLFKNIPLFAFAAATILTFTIFRTCQLLGFNYPTGSTQLITLLLFLFLWRHFGKGLSTPRFYALPLVLMGLYLLAALSATKGTLGIYGLGTLFTYFFIFVFLAAYNMRLDTNEVLDFFKVIYVIVPLLSLVTILDVLLNQVQFRNAFTLFREPGASAGILIYGVVVSLALTIIFQRNNYMVLALLLSLTSSISTYKKSLVTLVIVWLFYLSTEKRLARKVSYAYLFVLLALLGWSLVGGGVMRDLRGTMVHYTSETDAAPRAILLSTAYSISLRQFPFGSGMGTFASIPSVKFYSETYYDYGINKSWGMGPNTENTPAFFLLDCYWAHILGELGFVGTLLFLILWFYPSLRAMAIAGKTDDPLERGLKFFIYAMTGVITVDGLGYYYAENPAFIIIHAGLMGMALRLLECSRLPDEDALENNPAAS